MHPALFYTPGDRLSQPELSSARLDGHVVEIGDAYMPADTTETPEARAAGIRPLLFPGVAASGPTAAWIHGAGDGAPARHHVHRTSALRVRAPRNGRVVFHDTALGPTDVVLIGGVAVTSPVRTVVDLTLGVARHDGYAPWARALCRLLPDLGPQAAELLRHRKRIPGRRAALALLDELAQEDVTR